ncbi:copper resistance system multicopper oxidase [Sphingomonas sp.]|uniref:copper resistance system multicopper oxidase n=1 Tax=Sphingomonas sp. TaxID=28214 RepID=UPI002CC33D1E|nr:copper resistance system multicopper oxidase [Sphingomonas sp.]HTG39537.1 copper resistance system multicopper oxidase [Sphingomonas sp.]
MNHIIDRRALLRGAGIAGGGLALAAHWAGWASPVSNGAALPELTGEEITLTVDHLMRRVDGRTSHGIGINGHAPAPLIRLKEGQNVRIHVDNRLDEETSVHWHGLILPFQMDGVPGVSFPGIPARSRFTYEFPVVQSGTYWYHSHSGLQEQMGHYGPIVIDPAGADPVAFDREHVVVLSDHSPLHPHAIFRRLKLEPGYFNRQRQTLGGLLAGRDQDGGTRAEWGAMRMDPTDIADVTGSTYTYLVNGHGPADNWTALFQPGERVRLRFINASAMTTFNVRIPGQPMTVVAADGQNVRPVEVDEFQFAPAETYDVVVTPAGDRAWTIVGESIDRSGMARATLAPRIGMTAAVPPLRTRPVAMMRDMGMGAMGGDCAPEHAAVGHCSPDSGGHAMEHDMRDFSVAPQVRPGPGVQTISPMPVDRTSEPGQGLEGVGHRTLTYRQLVALNRNPDTRAPGREIEIHLTGNMERYMWSFDGVKFAHVDAPIPMRSGERVRVTLVNDTMMGHPIHLHGHFFELVTGHGDHSPRKHTVLVQPGGKVSWDVTADPGDWAFHCHMLYHMHAGMMQVVQVRNEAGAVA